MNLIDDFSNWIKSARRQHEARRAKMTRFQRIREDGVPILITMAFVGAWLVIFVIPWAYGVYKLLGG